MSVRFYIRPKSQAEASGIEPDFRTTWTVMGVVVRLGDRAGVIDIEDDGPVLPPNADDLDAETYEQAYDAAHKRWEAESLVRAGSLDAIKVPAVKLESSDDWIITARECRLIAEVLREATVDDVRSAYEADEENVKEWERRSTPPQEVEDRLRAAGAELPSYDGFMAGLHETVLAFAAYLEAAGRFSGVRVQ